MRIYHWPITVWRERSIIHEVWHDLVSVKHLGIIDQRLTEKREDVRAAMLAGEQTVECTAVTPSCVYCIVTRLLRAREKLNFWVVFMKLKCNGIYIYIFLYLINSICQFFFPFEYLFPSYGFKLVSECLIFSNYIV